MNFFKLKFIKLNKKIFFLLFILLFFPFYSNAYEKISGTLTEDTFFSRGVYVVDELSVESGATLTIEKGSFIKFFNNRSFLSVRGSLVVDGDDNDKVYFTSLIDDVGGDTNEDGVSLPSKSSWRNVSFSQGSRGDIKNAIFRYGGATVSPYATFSMITNFGGDVVLDNVHVSNYGHTGISQEEGSLKISKGLVSDGGNGISIKGKIEMVDTLIQNQSDYGFTFQGDAILKNNTFKNNWIVGVVDINSSFQEEGTVTESSFGINAWYLSGGVVREDSTLNKSNIPYMIYDSYIEIPEGVTLNINKGVILKFNQPNTGIRVLGNLNINGTLEEKVYLTSLIDDIGGDTNNDGGTIPSSGSWGNIYLGPNSNTNINNTIIKYAGFYGYPYYRQSVIENRGGILSISNTILSDYKIFGITNHDGKVSLSESTITNGLYALSIEKGDVVLNRNNIFNNYYALLNSKQDLVSAVDHYWGDATGPYHATLNPSGLGNSISGNVDFSPWVSEMIDINKPKEKPCTKDCNSSVMFFPGVEGSELYYSSQSKEEKAWVSSSENLQKLLLMDSYGDGIYSDIYTKDGASDEGVVAKVLVVPIYKSFIEQLQSLKDRNLINNFDLLPYDWRLSLNDIVSNGKIEDGKLYFGPQTKNQNYIIQKLEELQKTSKDGKVTLVGHSNGGLVIKALLYKLKNENHPLYQKIDRVILVGSPQVGTPEGLSALLHGMRLGPLGLILTKETARELLENMPAGYNLLPSQSYFTSVNTISDPVFTTTTGQNATSYEIMKDFILGGDDREKPKKSDLKTPNIGNSYLLNKSEEAHSILDSFIPDSHIQAIQVGGWGEATLKIIKYVVRNGKYSVKPVYTTEGDSTVVLPSALWMSGANDNVERWWVDLKVYNKNNTKRDHKNLLEIENLQGFIENRIRDNDGVINYEDEENIVINNPSLLQREIKDKRLAFTLHSPLTLGVYDEEGRYTGINKDGEIIEEVEGAEFRQIGEVKYLSIPKGIKYTLVLEGYEEGDYALDIEDMKGEDVLLSKVYEYLKTTPETKVIIEIEAGSKAEDLILQIDYENDGEIDEIYPKEETPEEEPNNTNSISTNSNQAGSINPPAVNTIQETQTQEEVVQNEEIPQGEVLGEETLSIAEADVLESIPESPKEEIQKPIQEAEALSQEIEQETIENTIQNTENSNIQNTEPNNTKVVFIIVLLILGIFIIFKLVKVL